MAAMSTGSTAARPGMTFSADITPDTTPDGLAALQREWSARIDKSWPMPGYGSGESGDFQVEIRAVKAHDVVIVDMGNYGRSFTSRSTGVRAVGDRVFVNLTRRGASHFVRQDRRATAPAGSLIAHDNGAPSLCEVGPGAVAKVLVLPVPVLVSLMGGRVIVGSARSAEARVLMAHASIVGETVHDLSPAGVLAARDALLELVRGTLMGGFDDIEPRLAPALARAAMKIADSRLGDPELSPASLAGELNVSVRTLHRAFAAAGEPVAAYIRRRRLEQARRELAASLRRPSVSEVAARWQFADCSHFIRAFAKQYGETPAQFARSGAPV
jgi:AraC-like DNA-binding protein